MTEAIGRQLINEVGVGWEAHLPSLDQGLAERSRTAPERLYPLYTRPSACRSPQTLSELNKPRTKGSHRMVKQLGFWNEDLWRPTSSPWYTWGTCYTWGNHTLPAHTLI
eukprot:486539-Pyramimonas_sp.AAC.2